MSTLFLKISKNKGKKSDVFFKKMPFGQKVLKKDDYYDSITFETMPHNTIEVKNYDGYYERKKYEKNGGGKQALHMHGNDGNGCYDGNGRREICYHKLLLCRKA